VEEVTEFDGDFEVHREKEDAAIIMAEAESIAVGQHCPTCGLRVVPSRRRWSRELDALRVELGAYKTAVAQLTEQLQRAEQKIRAIAVLTGGA